MMLGPANTDAVNRAGNLSYGEATGITQTIRNYVRASASPRWARSSSSTIGLVHYVAARDGPERDPCGGRGEPHIAQYEQGSRSVSSIPHFVSVDFAHSTQVVLYVMAGIMAAVAVVALLGLEAGRQETVREQAPAPVQTTGG
jgi:hypothetical protein